MIPRLRGGGPAFEACAQTDYTSAAATATTGDIMDSTSKFLFFIALPVVVLCSLVEALVLARGHGYDWKAAGVSFFDLFTRTIAQELIPWSIAAPFIAYAAAHRLTTIPLTTWQAIALLFLGQEFCYYWYHRSAHRMRWFWANHSVHHSPNELNLTAAVRIGPFGKLFGRALFYLPLVWLGFDARVVALTVTLNLLYQFWIHATWIPRLGWLEYVLNTPSAHRVHHAANLEYLDANYGGVLIIFDRLFGTYVAERADLPCRYGLVHPMTSYNPLRIEFAQTIALARDLVRARSLRAVAGYLFLPPGWSPDGPGDTTEELRRRAGETAADPLASASDLRARTRTSMLR